MRTKIANQDNNASEFNFPADPHIKDLRSSLRSQPGQKPYATERATKTILEVSETWRPLRYNELTQKIEYDGKPWDDWKIGPALAWFQDHDVTTTKEVLERCLVWQAQGVAYDPIKEYLESLRFVEPTDPIVNEIIAHMGFSPKDSDARKYAHKEILHTWLIARVARIYEPGCHVDEVPVLFGPQGLAKSGWAETLVPDRSWHQIIDANRLGRDKESMIILNGLWTANFDELPTTFSDKNAFKKFISATSDYYRPVFGKEPKPYPRRCVFHATHNPANGFLSDPTGERRLPVLNIADKIDYEWFIEHRDAINAWSLAAYRAGHSYRPSRESIEFSQNEHWVVDDWQELVEDWIATNPECAITIPDLYDHLGIDLKDQNQRMQTRLSNILMRLGYKRGRIYIEKKSWDKNGKNKKAQIRAWIRDTDPDPTKTKEPYPLRSSLEVIEGGRR
jgi:predicted P-loop ATPase